MPLFRRRKEPPRAEKEELLRSYGFDVYWDIQYEAHKRFEAKGNTKSFTDVFHEVLAEHPEVFTKKRPPQILELSPEEYRVWKENEERKEAAHREDQARQAEEARRAEETRKAEQERREWEQRQEEIRRAERARREREQHEQRRRQEAPPPSPRRPPTEPTMLVIEAVHRALAKKCHPDTGTIGDVAYRTQLMQRINAAKEARDLDELIKISKEIER